MIVWINGTFGVGKTTTARMVNQERPDVRLWDPEQVGYMLATVVGDVVVPNFQDWPSWRCVVVATGDAVSQQTGQHLVAPQTVLSQAYMQEILDGFAKRDVDVFHVLLDAEPEALRQRILDDCDEVQAQGWRLDHLAGYQRSRPWLTAAADFVVDTTDRNPGECAFAILTASGLQ